ncbi:hypothetical protein UB31_11715 [Bradyrhizobium sp. LTSP849]|nr:hypothetical protein UB31_11715 [Bradyrhizobium sp. LTSP849]
MADSFYYRGAGADLRTTRQEVVETESVKVQDVDIPDYVRGIFCEPVLLEGEDSGLYWKMVCALIEERKPRTMSDWIALHDLSTKLWEERLFRRASNALIRCGKLAAVQQILDEIIPGESNLKRIQDNAARRGNKYFSENEKERNEIHSLLAKFGVTEAELYARSAQNNSEALLMWEG